MIQYAIDKCNVHNLSNLSKFQMLYPLKNLQFSMNTDGPYGPSGGERVNCMFHVFACVFSQISVIKAKVHDATGMPAGKQKLHIEVFTTFLSFTVTETKVFTVKSCLWRAVL